MLIDSNIIIYAAQPQHAGLRQFITEHAPYVSAVSYVEVLGFHGLDEQSLSYFEAFFATSTILPITQPVLDQAVYLRRTRRMSLGDALIAATCLVHDIVLVTRNVADFKWVSDLRLHDPFESLKQWPEDDGGTET